MSNAMFSSFSSVTNKLRGTLALTRPGEGEEGASRNTGGGGDAQREAEGSSRGHRPAHGSGEGGGRGTRGRGRRSREEADQRSRPGNDLPSGPPPAKTKYEVLEELNEGYFEAEFDSLAYEVSKLPPDVNDVRLEETVEQLQLALEVVSEKLSSHVMKNHDQFVCGIDTVASVQDDLQSCLVVTKQGRASLQTALDEVDRNMAIAEQHREKQGFMRVLTILIRLRAAVQLRSAFMQASESGEFALAMEAYGEIMKALQDPVLIQLHVVVNLASQLKLDYGNVKAKMDVALQAVCIDFRPVDFENVLFGYLNDGSEAMLGDKIHACFHEAISSQAFKAVTSMLLTHKSKRRAEELPPTSDSFAELCKRLPGHVFRSCLARVLETLFDLMVSYHIMEQWTAVVTEQNSEQLIALREVLAEARDREPAEGSGGEMSGMEDLEMQRAVEAQRDALDRCLRDILSSLEMHRASVWELVQRRVRDLLTAEVAFAGEHFLQVLEWSQRFVGAGEAFGRGIRSSLRQTLEIQCGKFFEKYHEHNLRVLAEQLRHETWLGIHVDPGSDAHRRAASLLQAMRNPIAFNSRAEEGTSSPLEESKTFDWWMAEGNPFRRDGAPRRAKLASDMRLNFGGHSVKYSLLEASKGTEVDLAGLPVNNGSAPCSNAGDSKRGSVDEDVGVSPESEDDGPEEVMGEYIDEDSQTVRMAAALEGEAPESSGAGGTRETQNIISNAGYQMLKWMKAYAELMVPLKCHAESIFRGMCDLFEYYMLHVFMTFCGVSVPQLAELSSSTPPTPGPPGATPQLHELVTPRLATTIVRLASAPFSPYREALQKAQEEAASTGMLSSMGLKMKTPGTTSNFTMAAFKTKFKTSSSSVDATTTSAGSGTMPENVASSNNLYGVRQGVIAIGSLKTIGREMAGARAALAAHMPESVASIDAFFGKSVDTIDDVQECMFSIDAARILAQAEPGRDISSEIANTKYDHKDLPERSSPWVQTLLVMYETFRLILESSTVPQAGIAAMWEHAVKQGDRMIVDGFLRAKRCTANGRMAMRLDMNGVIKGLSAIAPQPVDTPASSAPPQVRLNLTEKYIAAWFLPDWEGIKNWALTECIVLGKHRVMTVLGLIAEREKMKRKDLKDFERTLDEICM